MKRLLPFIFITSLFCDQALAQKLTGQWKGEFTDESSKFSGLGGERCRYVLDIDIKGKQVSGFSYTYYDEDGKTYYTICKLNGFVDHKKGYVEVEEVERTKTNVPVTVRNCFQVHRLQYNKQGDREWMQGTWQPAPNQGSGCGYGNTSLARRTLSSEYKGYLSTSPKSGQSGTAFAAREKVGSEYREKKVIKSPFVAQKPSPRQEIAQSLTPHTMLAEKNLPMDCATPSRIREMRDDENPLLARFEKRNTSLIKTIFVQNRKVKVDLYDNGEIDGDSISVFYNGNLLLSSKRLTSSPISLVIPVEDDSEVNELVMYAENLGSIAPNTALMVVTDGSKRHEVRISSDLQKSGTIHFIRKEQ